MVDALLEKVKGWKCKHDETWTGVVTMVEDSKDDLEVLKSEDDSP